MTTKGNSNREKRKSIRLRLTKTENRDMKSNLLISVVNTAFWWTRVYNIVNYHPSPECLLIIRSISYSHLECLNGR